MTISQRIKEIVRTQGIKQTVLAERMNKDERWVSNRLIGSVRPLADDLPLFARALGVTVDLFFEESLRPQFNLSLLGNWDNLSLPEQLELKALAERVRALPLKGESAS